MVFLKMENIRKILIFKLCCLGDTIFNTPAIINLKRNFPDAKIYLIASGWINALKNYLPEIDEVIQYDPPFEEGIIAKIFSSIKLIRLLRKEKFDLVFLGHRTSYFGMILMLSGIPYRFGFSVTKFLNKTAPFDNTKPEVLRYLDVLEANDIKIHTRETMLKKTKTKEQLRSELNLPQDKKIIGIFPFGGVNPGTQMRIKRWGIQRYENLIRIIESRYEGKAGVLLFEGKLDEEKYDINKDFKYTYKRTSDFESIAACDLFISGDTGLVHIAAAFDIPTIALFGPSDPRLFAPLQMSDTPHIYIWKKPPCSPCYTPETSIDKSNKKYWDGNIFKCFTGTHECIKEITEEEVFQNIKNILGI